MVDEPHQLQGTPDRVAVYFGVVHQTLRFVAGLGFVVSLLLTAAAARQTDPLTARPEVFGYDRSAPFDVRAFLESAGVSPRIVRFGRGAQVFSQGAQANRRPDA